MVQSVLLSVSSGDDGWWRRPGALRALAYALFDRVDPDLARALHAMEGQRPFTIAVLEEAGCPYVRVTALDEVTSHALVAGVTSLEGVVPLTFGETSVRTLGYALDAPPLASRAAYAELARARFETHVALEFVTPSAFSQGGDLHLPLPVPDLMLRSWARRWNEFASPALQIPEEEMDGLAANVGLARARLETTTVSLGAGKLIGFTGAVTLEALRPRLWPEAERQAFAALAAYSRYCGTGVRTTQGLGLTLPDESRPRL